MMISKNFQKQKKDFLAKQDKSKKGSIDKKIKALVETINSLPAYYTTSSCSGRIVLFSSDPSGRKDRFQWHFVSHDVVSYPKLKQAFEKISEKEVWFMIEPIIMHIAACDIAHAKKLLYLARDIGYKRAGIISIREDKVVMELNSTECLQTIVKKGAFAIENEHLKLLCNEANTKLKKTWQKIEKLKKETMKI